MEPPTTPRLAPGPAPRSAGAGARVPLLLLGLAGALLASGCAGEEKYQAESALEYADNAKRDYQAALAAFEDKNWELADELLNEVKRKYAYSRYARLAELRLADANYQQEKFAESITSYKEFVHDHPNDPEVGYARYRIAKAEYDSVSQSILLPPLEERDLASVNDALTTLKSYLADYPSSEHRDELRYMLDVVLGLLARHELYVARYYLREDRFDAAVARCEYSLSMLKNSGLEPEAMVLLGEIYMKQERRKDARDVLNKLLTLYPDSAFSVPARNFLAQLDKT